MITDENRTFADGFGVGFNVAVREAEIWAESGGTDIGRLLQYLRETHNKIMSE